MTVSARLNRESRNHVLRFIRLRYRDQPPLVFLPVDKPVTKPKRDIPPQNFTCTL